MGVLLARDYFRVVVFAAAILNFKLYLFLLDVCSLLVDVAVNTVVRGGALRGVTAFIVKHFHDVS